MSGMLATNTISQGDTRALGLAWLTSNGFSIIRAESSRHWPGQANLEVALVWLIRGSWKSRFHLDGLAPIGITSYLAPPQIIHGDPFSLRANQGVAFEGAKTIGLGFVLGIEEASRLLSENPRNSDVIHPYLNGQDINSHPNQFASRMIINFKDWPLSPEDNTKNYLGPYASEYPECLKILESRVKPERLSYPADSPWNRSLRERWWQFALWRPALHSAIESMDKVIVRSRVSNLNLVAVVSSKITFSDATVVFASESMAMFGLLQSVVHTIWVEKYASTMRNDFRYTPSSCFETFPQCSHSEELGRAAVSYNNIRSEALAARKCGLTKLYKLFHDSQCNDLDVSELRASHAELDLAVVRTYGWFDFDLAHAFYSTRHGIRYTISESSRIEILDRLLKLNHERHAAEVASGDHRKSKAKRPGRKSVETKQDTLF